MARIVVFAPFPPSRSSAGRSGKALARLLRRALRGRHDVQGVWPVPESVDLVLRDVDLPLYLLANAAEEREIYELAMERPGLVVLEEPSLERVVQALVRARDPLGFAARREAERLRTGLEERGVDPDAAWSAQAARRARGVVVHSDEHRRALRATGCRTPIHVAPPPTSRDASAYVRAVEDTLRLAVDPAEWTLARWTTALLDVGVRPEELQEGYGVRYAAALQEIRTSPAGDR